MGKKKKASTGLSKSKKLDSFINQKSSTKSIKAMDKDFMKTVKSGKVNWKNMSKI